MLCQLCLILFLGSGGGERTNHRQFGSTNSSHPETEKQLEGLCLAEDRVEGSTCPSLELSHLHTLYVGSLNIPADDSSKESMVTSVGLLRHFGATSTKGPEAISLVSSGAQSEHTPDPVHAEEEEDDASVTPSAFEAVVPTSSSSAQESEPARPVSPSVYMMRLPPPLGSYIQNEHSYHVGNALLWKRRAEAALDALDKAQRQLQACKRREQRLRMRICGLQQERMREKRVQTDVREKLKEHLQVFELQLINDFE